MSNPGISVIVPAYNAERYLRECIRSIENQTYDNFNIILINDGSTDGTAEIIDELSREYDNIITANAGNMDIAAVRSMGLDMVDNEYFTFVDSDDRILPNLLQILMDTALETGADIVGSSFIQWSTKSEWETIIDSVAPNPNPPVLYTPEEYLTKQVFGLNNSRCWSKLYKRSVVGDLHFEDGIVVGEDVLFVVRLLLQVSKIAELDYQGYAYYSNPSGAMLRPFNPRYMSQIRSWELIREETGRLAPESTVCATKNILISLILTAGKLALLSRSEQKKYQNCIDEIHSKLKLEAKDRVAYGMLPKGYQLKGYMFMTCPKMYLALYHLRGLV